MSGNYSWKTLVRQALDEDLGTGDITTAATVDETVSGTGRIICKQNGVLSGSRIAEYIFGQVDNDMVIRQNYSDGAKLGKGETVMQLQGKLASVLQAERVALNFMAHLSGVATMTAEFVELIQGTGAKIIDTRKTTPLLRAMEKQAVVDGGGHNHRMGLYDMVLIKENHIRAAGGIRKAVEQTIRFLASTGIKCAIEVETRNLDEVKEALTTKIDRIMLDNMPPDEMSRAVRLIDHKAEVEASGGVTRATVRQIAETGVDYISVGALTHSTPAFDFSLLLD